MVLAHVGLLADLPVFIDKSPNIAMAAHNLKLDSKGRVIVPNAFREALGIKPGQNIEAHLDKDNGRIMLFPIEKATKKLSIRFGDAPGSLANVAHILSRNKVDLIYTSSRSLKRGKEAEWEVIADFSKTNIARLKMELGKEKGVKGFRLERLEK